VRTRFFIFHPLTVAYVRALVRALMTSGVIMDEVRKSELADFGASFAQVSSDATRKLCEHGQSVAKTISEWNAEVSDFLSHRAARNSEAMGRMAKCQNLPEIFTIQTQWVREASDDYLNEMSKLMEVNSRIMGGLLGSFGRVEMQSAEQPRSSTAKVPMRAAS
jgi:Phasin protein